MKVQSRRLLVEGDEDKRVIPELLEANGIAWGETKDEAIVDIEPYNGIDRLLAREVIETELKASGLRSLGILVDADQSAPRTWQRMRQRCLASFPALPAEIPSSGLIHSGVTGIRLGVWIMPDNRLVGELRPFSPTLFQMDRGLFGSWPSTAPKRRTKPARPSRRLIATKPTCILGWLGRIPPAAPSTTP